VRVLAAVVLLACAPRVDVIATHERERPSSEPARVSECRIAGMTSPDASARLFGGRDGDDAFAHFNARRV